VSPAEAERRAESSLASRVYKERCREARGLRMLDDLRADLHYAARTLTKSPSFFDYRNSDAGAGHGANTGLFTMMNIMYGGAGSRSIELYQVSDTMRSNKVRIVSIRDV